MRTGWTPAPNRAQVKTGRISCGHCAFRCAAAIDCNYRLTLCQSVHAGCQRDGLVPCLPCSAPYVAGGAVLAVDRCPALVSTAHPHAPGVSAVQVGLWHSCAGLKLLDNNICRQPQHTHTVGIICADKLLLDWVGLERCARRLTCVCSQAGSSTCPRTWLMCCWYDPRVCQAGQPQACDCQRSCNAHESLVPPRQPAQRQHEPSNCQGPNVDCEANRSAQLVQGNVHPFDNGMFYAEPLLPPLAHRTCTASHMHVVGCAAAAAVVKLCGVRQRGLELEVLN